MSEARKRIDGWMQAAHGIYLYRDGPYDEGPLGDNWSYIDPRTLCIMDYRPDEGEQTPSTKGVIIAGPFPSLEVAKAAYLVMYGGSAYVR